MIKYEDCKIVRGPDGKPKFNVDIEETPITLGLKRNISQAAILYCKCCNISLDSFVNITVNQAILSMNFPKQIEKEVDALLEGEQLSLGPSPGYFKKIKEMRKRLDEELAESEEEKKLFISKEEVEKRWGKIKEEDSTEVKENHTPINLDKNIARILTIFANYYSDKSTEDKRINNFISEEVTKITEALAADPPEQFPESLKQIIHRRLNEYKNNKKGLEDLK